MTNQRLLGLLFFGNFFVWVSLFQLCGFIFDYKHYQLQFSYLTPEILNLRYCFSILGRVLHIIVGIGLLKRKESFRKIAVWGALGMIATVTLRHPFLCIFNQTRIVWDQSGVEKTGLPITFDFIFWVTLAAIFFMDTLFYGTLIYYLTRPKVKFCFSKKEG